MEKLDITNAIDVIVADMTDRDAKELKPEFDLKDDLGLDSIDTIEVTMIIEKEFNIVVDDTVVENIKTLGDFHSEIEKIINN